MASTEELCIKKIRSGMIGIKSDKITPKDANCGYFFKQLKPLNEGMYEDLISEYKIVMKKYNERNYGS